MRVEDIKDYIESKPMLTKISFDAEVAENTYFMVIKTKETYVFEDEQDADAMVDEVRRNPNFIGVEKKYKAGKMNKAGDIVKPETWTVVAKLAH